jgi:hypothetical protein
MGVEYVTRLPTGRQRQGHVFKYSTGEQEGCQGKFWKKVLEKLDNF